MSDFNPIPHNGAMLREWRRINRLTQRQVARALGVSLATIGNWELCTSNAEFTQQAKDRLAFLLDNRDYEAVDGLRWRKPGRGTENTVPNKESYANAKARLMRAQGEKKPYDETVAACNFHKDAIGFESLAEYKARKAAETLDDWTARATPMEPANDFMKRLPKKE